VRRDDEALVVLNNLISMHPAFMAETVAFDRALLLTRLRRFAEAALAYQSAIALGLDAGATPIILANMAEVTMLAGDLETAVKHYEHALREARGGRDGLLALWGLAVALDRLGEHDSALRHITKATTAEGGSMHVLRSDGVFFEPDYERLYYEALGHEVMAHEDPANRVRELDQAASGLVAFIAASGVRGAFTQVAQLRLVHIEALRQAARRDAR
jgi:tetratricopeptide (TPR) repeat protein